MPTEDPKIPLRRDNNNQLPAGMDYAAYMRSKLGLGTPVTAGPMGMKSIATPPRKEDPQQITLGGPQLDPTKTVNSNQYSWNSDIGKTAPGTSVPKQSLASRVFSKANQDKMGEIVDKAAPFMSNIVNAFRKPPMPKRGTPNPYVNLQKINLQEERNAVERGTGVANKATERNVDANTAEAIKQFNKGTEFERLSQINDKERQANTGIANQQAVMDVQTTASNNDKTDDFNQALAEREVASQREQSANFANAGDKLVAIKNEKEKGRVEMEKAKVLRSVYGKSGVLKRDNAIGQQWKKDGIPDPFGEDYKWLDKTDTKAYGGVLRGIPSRKLQMN
jgi:hypothetical protein